jgi:anaerobic ribonucleoside-triphosphate reductase activating protein
MNCAGCGTSMIVVTNQPGSWLCPRCDPQNTLPLVAWELEVERVRTEQRTAAAMTTAEWRQTSKAPTERELVWIVDPTTGDLVVEGLEMEEALALVADVLPAPRPVNCAQPLALAPLPPPVITTGPALHVVGLWHGSVVEGPGRRSVLQVQGCPLRCSPACYVPTSHAFDTGAVLPVEVLLEALLDPLGEPRDGASVIGGEPFGQPVGLAALLRELKARDVHTTVYTGYTLQTLVLHGDPAVREALELTNLLIDGPFVPALADHAGEWRGSRNQRLIAQPATVVGQLARPRGGAPDSV